MPFDFIKEYKEFYQPKNKLSIINVPKMIFIAVQSKGNPNMENGEYKKSLKLLYNVAYTIKMSYKGKHKINGFFEYVVPPLEGLWWQDHNNLPINYLDKDKFVFISLIRLPDFVTKEDFIWAINEATKNKNLDFSKVEYFTYNEGLCVQCMHIGSYDDEPKTIKLMQEYIEENSYELDFSSIRKHHEIYLSNPQRCNKNKLKTIIRLPIKKVK